MRLRFPSVLILVWGLVLVFSSGNARGQDAAKTDAAHPTAPVRSRPDIPESVLLIENVVYGRATRDDGQPMDLILDAAFPRDSGAGLLPAVVYIHGGAYRMGSKEMGLPFIVSLAEGGYFAVSINYRLIQQSKLPAAAEDCREAIRFLHDHADELGIDAERIGVWGHSAGGHLSALLGTSGNHKPPDSPDSSNTKKKSARNHPVRCVVDFFGPVDFTLYTATERGRRKLRDAFAGDEATIRKALPAINPITFVDKNDPPFLIIHGDADRLVPIRHSQMLKNALTEAGVEAELIIMEGAGHGAGGAGIYRRVMAFFDHHLGGQAREAVNKRHFPPPDSPPRIATPNSSPDSPRPQTASP